MAAPIPWPPFALAILNSLVQLGGVALLGWPIGNIFLLLWIENVIITLVAIVRMAGVRNAPDGGMGTKLMTSFALLFFCLVHGGFAITLAFSTGLDLTMTMFVAPLILLVVRYAVEVIGWYAGGHRPATVSEAHGFAMRRVVMLHVAIIACWGLIIMVVVQGGLGRLPEGWDLASLPLLVLGVLLVIKTIAELHAIRVGPNAPTSWKLRAGRF